MGQQMYQGMDNANVNTGPVGRGGGPPTPYRGRGMSQGPRGRGFSGRGRGRGGIYGGDGGTLNYFNAYAMFG